MTYDAIVISVTDRRSGTLLGIALLCPDARYSSVRWTGRDRLDRLFASPQVWWDLQRQVRIGIPPRPIDPISPVAKLFEGDQPTQLAWLRRICVDVDRPEQAAERLDRQLLEVAVSTSYADVSAPYVDDFRGFVASLMDDKQGSAELVEGLKAGAVSEQIVSLLQQHASGNQDTREWAQGILTEAGLTWEKR
jgi:hypothetical protein